MGDVACAMGAIDAGKEIKRKIQKKKQGYR